MSNTHKKSAQESLLSFLEKESRKLSGIEKHINDAQQACSNLVKRVEEVFSESLSKTKIEKLAHYQAICDVAKRVLPIYHPNLNAFDFSEFKFDALHIPEQITTAYQALDDNGKPVYLPLSHEFMSTESSFYYDVDDNTQEEKLYLMHNMVMRLNMMLPNVSQFCLLDPARMGESFPYFKQIPFKRPLGHDVANVLDEVLNDIKRIKENYLDNRTKRLQDVDEDIRGNEKFEFIFAANFPKGYDRRSIELLAKIANAGPTAGKYVVIQRNTSVELPSGVSMDAFDRLIDIGAANVEQCVPGVAISPLSNSLLSDETINTILDTVAKAKPKESKLEFTDVTNTDSTSWWQKKSDYEIRVAIGGSGAKKDDLELWFGESNGRQICAHGMLGAMTGAGKSNLYHAMILGLACSYSPDELQLYLIDGKQGVEFKCYPSLPHAKVVSLNTSPDLSRSVLNELVDEMIRRNEMFKRLGFDNLRDYRLAGSPEGALPRLLLVVDEYQTLFEDDRDGVGSELMDKLATQGRSAGVHMFVGSQRFGAAGMQNQQSIFGNIHLRVGMQMSDADVTALQEFGPNGKRLLRACKEAGQVVINDSAANDDKNRAGRVTYLSDELRASLIDQLAEKWEQEKTLASSHKSILLDGTGQPSLVDNPQLNHLFAHYNQRPTDEERMQMANRPQYLAGLGDDEWYPVEKPSAYWLGREMNIHGQANVTFRRRPNEHMLFVGDANEPRLGMLSNMLVQLNINHAADQFELYLLDRSIKGSPWNGILSRATENCVNGAVHYNEQFNTFAENLHAIGEEYERRRSMDEEQMLSQPSIYVMVSDAQRVNELQQQNGRFGVKEHGEVGGIIRELLEGGAEYGIHLIMSFDNVRSLMKAFDRRDVDLFKHKVVLQMSEDDSFALIKSRHAANLQQVTKVPVYALYVNQTLNKPVKFKPYCYSSVEVQQQELDVLRSKIGAWG
ncbi:FtsK/SpoIIIE domain-containing protein [Thaumasiovibrio sp. DFM-14]|uniref:FtsK/SpoIIIE domain-containing protein n=1 Tax=Thaumasiovibrio sp. DFM-14 TaxID=3384792 RepID=UPI0039A169AF